MKKILVIDDDEILLKGVSLYLSANGYSVLSTADGPQGIMIYKSEKPDVVMLDIGLPSLDGLEVLKKIIEYDPKAKIIIASGYGSPNTINQALKDGAYAFIDKPFDIEEFKKLLNEALGL
jgi:DNA-binding NtrC family response regulator